MSLQSTFATALLAPECPAPDGLRSWNGSDPAQRFAVYRNNVTVSLVDALADTFGVVQRLVGEPFFRAMAREFVRAQPPRSRVLATYGQAFPDFIANFAPAASVPYLADVAQLEMLRVLAYHAADAQPVALNALQRLLADPQQLAAARFQLHPSVQLLASPFAVQDLWDAHLDAGEPTGLDPDHAQCVLVFRHEQTVAAQALDPATWRFYQALQQGHTLADAAERAVEAGTELPGLQAVAPAAVELNLSAALALLLHWSLITQVFSGDPDHESAHGSF